MFIDHKIGLKVIIMMFIQIALSAMMVKDYKHMIKLQHTHMEQMLLRCVKVKC